MITNVIEDFKKRNNNSKRTTSNNDSLSDDGDVNLYEMRVPIGKTYDTSDISVQLEGPKILIHCHTIEPTDKRGNYRKHEYKSELLVFLKIILSLALSIERKILFMQNGTTIPNLLNYRHLIDE